MCAYRLWPTDVVQAHLVSHGICRGYDPWVFNGESSFAKTFTEIPNSHVQENPIEYADLVTCCMTCSSYMIWHLGKWKKH